MAANIPSIAAAQYGAPIGEHRGSPARIFLVIASIALIAIGAVIVVGAATQSSSDSSGLVAAIIAGAIFLGGALYCFWTLLSWRGAHAQLFEQGFVISRAGKTTAARWDDISSVTQQIVQSRYYGIPVWTSYRYDIALNNGEKVRVNSGFGKAGNLGDAIQRMSANVLTPRAIAAYQSGASIPFGKISVSQAGISKGTETMPWNLLKQLGASSGRVFITRTDRRLAWFNTPISKVPNYYVLNALVAWVQRGGQ